MSVQIITEFPVECKICKKTFKKLNGLSRHLTIAHNLGNITYTIQFLLNNDIPKCQCGCGKDVQVYNYKHNEFCIGHTGGGMWQLMYDKESEKYKEITKKISNSIKEYQKDNPVIISESQRKQQSEYMKNLKENNPTEFLRRNEKMKQTKRQQSEDGILSERHWTKTHSKEDVIEISKKISIRSSITKQRKFSSGELQTWNKGLNKYIDPRVENYSGKNHYRSTDYEKLKYSGLFRCKEYRNLLLEMQNNICFACKDVPNNKSLCLHHIDGNPECNNFDNLIFLCRSCHMKIHNKKQLRDNLDLMVAEFKRIALNDLRIIEFKTKYNVDF